MNENSPSPEQAPVHTVAKPLSITIFGALNIVYGGFHILSSPFAILGYIYLHGEGKVTLEEMAVGMFNTTIGFCITVWLVILGIGLLKFKKWSRRGCVMYSWVDIAVILLGAIGYTVLAFIPEAMPQEEILAILIVDAPLSLIYPVLLLIFMQTAKVKDAFKVIEK